MNPPWAGIFPAMTTKFRDDESINFELMVAHIQKMLDAGVHGIVVLGSLGENGTLSAEEKQEIIRHASTVCSDKVPLLAGVAETTTLQACRFVQQASDNGADGFMLLPGMQYVSDKHETIRHLRSVARVSSKPIMIYNNPVAYRVDITPEMFAELADEPKFVAIKESSENIRRITDIRNLVGNRYRMFVGVDDLALESLVLGADGWLAGLVCAFPKETVALYELTKSGRIAEALSLYRWFMPLLHLDVSTKFIQNIKLAESMTGHGNEHVRAPRLPLSGKEREIVQRIIATAIATRPELPEI